jgi:hypothetical protein
VLIALGAHARAAIRSTCCVPAVRPAHVAGLFGAAAFRQAASGAFVFDRRDTPST